MEKKKQIMVNFNQFIELVSHWKNNFMDFGDGIALFRGEIHILFFIGNYPGTFSSEIARKFGVTRAVISKTLKKLKHNEYVYKVSDPTDRKRSNLYLTEKGWAAYYAHERFMLENNQYMYDYLEQLSDENLTAINQFLENAHKMIVNHF